MDTENDVYAGFLRLIAAVCRNAKGSERAAWEAWAHENLLTHPAAGDTGRQARRPGRMIPEDLRGTDNRIARRETASKRRRQTATDKEPLHTLTHAGRA